MLPDRTGNLSEGCLGQASEELRTQAHLLSLCLQELIFNLLSWGGGLHVCGSCTHLCVPAYVFEETRGSPWAFYSVTLCLVPLRQALSQNPELGQTTSAISVSAPPHSTG